MLPDCGMLRISSFFSAPGGGGEPTSFGAAQELSSFAFAAFAANLL
jgi:hypothetical protein